MRQHQTTTSQADAVHEGGARARRWGGFLLLGAITFAVYGSLLPFNFEPAAGLNPGSWFERMPAGFRYSTGHIDFFSNISLFVPIGVGGMAWVTRSYRWGEALVATGAVTMLALGMSLAVEGGQTLLPGRVASIADVAAQGTGALIGCIIWILGGHRVRQWLARLDVAERPYQRFEVLLYVYFAFHVFMSFFPLDVTIHPAELYSKLERGRINLIPFVDHIWTGELIAEMLLFGFACLPCGALATLVWRQPATGLRNISDSIAVGFAMVVGIEACQLLIVSRFTDATQIVFGGGGAAIGVLLMHAFWPNPHALSAGRRSWLQTPGTWIALAMAYAFIPAAFLLWPYDFVFDSDVVKSELTQMLGIPFEQLMNRSPLRIQTILLRDVLLYLPFGLIVGAAAASASPRWRTPLACGGLAGMMVIATCIELLQAVVPSRVPDITNIVTSMLAGFAGVMSLSSRPAKRWILMETPRRRGVETVEARVR